MDIKLEKQENSTYEIAVKVLKENVSAVFEESLKHEAEELEIKGFRKGKAPLNLVKESADKAKLRTHALNHLLTDIFNRVVQEYRLVPIIYPRFEIKKFEEGEEAEFIMRIVEKPEIVLTDYVNDLKLVQVESTEAGRLTNQAILDTVVKNSKVGISKLLLDEEINRMMSSLIDQTAKMGLTIEDYLRAQNKTVDKLREEYAKSAEATIKTDFILTEIAAKEGVEVSDAEIESAISAAPDEQSRQELQKPQHKSYIKAVLLKSKTLQKLMDYAKVTS